MAFTTTADAELLSQNAEEVSEILKLMAHPLRMRILCQLTQGECSVGELIEASQAPQPTVSQILLKMKAEGLLAARRDGRFIHYRIQDPRVGKLMKSLKRIFCEPSDSE